MRLRTLPAALAAVALISGGAIAAPGPFSVHIALHDHGFGFRNIGIRAAKVRLEVTNRGEHKHDLAVASRGTAGSARPRVVAATRLLAPGQTAMLKLKLKPGRYRLFSKYDDDRAQGLSAPLARDGADAERRRRDEPRVL